MRRVVVTGRGVISSLGNDIESFSQNLMKGISGIGPITHFDTTDFKAKLAAEVKGFDPVDYGISPKDARHMDAFTQYALGAARQAMDSSRLAGKIDPDRFGVYVGSGVGGMETFVEQTHRLADRGPERVSPFFITMIISNMAAGQIAIEYGAQGPTLPIVTACATSANTIGEAYRAIAHDYADAILAGGAEATVVPLSIAGFTTCKALSLSDDPARSLMPFDKDRGGFVMGEGAGMLLLEEREHALGRGAHILGEICGYGNTCDAHHVTAPKPDGSSAAKAIAMAVKQASLESQDLVYINAHGTGTPLNDATETRAIKTALGEMAYQALISSTKAMTGHMLGAAGAIESIVCLLALEQGLIPPTVHHYTADPECDLDYVPGVARKIQATLALNTSLGFGGHNACLAFRSHKEG